MFTVPSSFDPKRGSETGRQVPIPESRQVPTMEFCSSFGVPNCRYECIDNLTCANCLLPS
jgi:hypothetical protein